MRLLPLILYGDWQQLELHAATDFELQQAKAQGLRTQARQEYKHYRGLSYATAVEMRHTLYQVD